MNGNANGVKILDATTESIDDVDCEIKAEIIEPRVNIMNEIIKDVEQKVSIVKVIDNDLVDTKPMKKSLSDDGGARRADFGNINEKSESREYKNHELVSLFCKKPDKFYFFYVLSIICDLIYYNINSISLFELRLQNLALILAFDKSDFTNKFKFCINKIKFH